MIAEEKIKKEGNMKKNSISHVIFFIFSLYILLYCEDYRTMKPIRIRELYCTKLGASLPGIQIYVLNEYA